MRRALAILLAATISATVGCGRTPNSPFSSYLPPTFGPQDSTFTDEQVRAAVYSSYLSPPGFYSEPGYATAPYYVNTASISPTCCPPLDTRELATNDTVQARAWAESTIAHSNGVAPLDDQPLVTERFIEFRPPVAALSGGSGVPMRAHRLSYLLPLPFNPAFFSSDSTLGTFNVRPVDIASARGLAEYLWLKWNRQTRGAKVLSSYGLDEGAIVDHVIYEVQTLFGDFHMHDDLRLYRLDFRISKATGAIILRRTLQRRVVGAGH